jgi:hypothetical protein
MDNVTIDVTSPVPGIDIVQAPTLIIPSTLDTMQTGVGSITLALRARLQAQSYAVPIEVRADGMTPPMFDTICVNVPGVLATVTASNVVSPALCPTIADTIGLPVNINGPRCLPLVGFRLLGATSATVRLATTLPYQLNARGTTAVPLEVIAATVGTFPVDVEVHVREYESLRDGDTTWVDHFDTITVTVNGKLAEYSVIGLVDTLDMGEVCINDSLFSDQLIENIGGCDVTITSLQFSNTAGGRFSTAPSPTIPVTFARTEIIRPRLQFVSSTAGVFVGTLRVESVALPGIKSIPVKARVVTPQYTTIDTLDLDTICTNVDVVRTITISTPVNCPADIDTVVVLTNGSITTSFSGPFTVPPRGSVSLPLTIRRTVDGPFIETVTLRSATAGDHIVVVRGMVGTARLLTPALVDAGDVRVGATRTLTTTITHQGSLPLTITQLRVLGPSATEYVVRPAGAVTLPVTMAPNSTLDVEIDAAPTDIETRAAQLFITTLRPPCELTAPIDLTMRGIQPLLSTDRPQTDVGVQCVAGTVPVSVGVRNRGNAPLNITGVRTDAPELVVTSTFPIALAAGDSASLEFVLTPSSLGVVAIGVRIDHDGDFAVQADTVVTVQYRGVVCGSIAADTTVGVVGDVSVISVQWFSDPGAPLTLDQVIQLLAARNEGLRFSIAHDGRVIRGRAVTGGVVNTATTNAVFSTDTITIDAPQPQTNGSNVLARIEVDLLRGGADRTVLGVDVQQLASGDAEVDVLPGQVRSLLCAYDERALIVPGFAIMRLADGSDLVGTGVTQPARLDLYTIDGRWLEGRDVAPTSSGVVYLPLEMKRADGYLILAVLSMHDRIATTLLRMP